MTRLGTLEMRNLLTILTAAALLLAGNCASAVPYPAAVGDTLPPAGREPHVAMQQGSGMTLDRAVEQVRRQCKGRIVSAETQVSGGRETHVIKCLTGDGKVKTYRIPGRRA